MIGWKMLKDMWRELPMWSKIGLMISLTVLGVSVVGCNWKIWKNYPQDNIVEEIIEEVIEGKTGLDIDLSPFSPEAKNVEKKRVELEIEKPVKMTTRLKFLGKAIKMCTPGIEH